jgi:transcription termination factor NusB
MDKNEKLIKRHTRLTVIASLYLVAFRNKTTATVDSNKLNIQFIAKTLKADKVDLKLAKKNFRSVGDNREIINDLIKEYSTKRKIEEINLITLGILQNAINEGFIEHYVSPKIAISEAIEIAKSLVTHSQVNFISGILGKIYDKKKDELQKD